MEIFNHTFVQLGFAGILITALILSVKYLASFFMKQMNETIVSEKQVECEFRTYLKDSNKQMIEIIAKNTKAFDKMNESLRSNAEAFIKMNESLKSNAELLYQLLLNKKD